ncbi:hypothetical protein, partial [Nocardia brasiliensis]|uniref:hypothetical protein n=1 Tax=Nocardia brasiliensis TaxID=37326 RepID=UPI002457A140
DHTEAVLARVRAAAERAGLFTELDSEWLPLDTELMPWSAKALGLLRSPCGPRPRARPPPPPPPPSQLAQACSVRQKEQSVGRPAQPPFRNRITAQKISADDPWT